MASPMLINGVASPQNIHTVSTTKHHPLGTRGSLFDGRVFYYASLVAGSSTLARANLLISRAVASAVTAQTTSGGTLTAGATRVNFDTAGAIATNQLVDGFAVIQNSTGEGQEYRIRSHTTVGGAGVITADLYDPIVIAGSATSDVTLFANAYRDPQATTTLGAAAGVTKVGVTTNASSDQYYWLQTWGEAACLTVTTMAAVGQGIIQGTGTAGTVVVGAAATDANLGQARLAPAASGDFGLMFLRIRP